MTQATLPPTGTSSPAAPDAAAYFNERKGKLSLWTGVLGGAVAWGIQLQLGYVLSRFSCPRHWVTVMHHVSTFLLLAAAVWCTLLALRDWNRAGRDLSGGSDAGVTGRSRFLSGLGVLTSGLFSLVIAAQWVPVFFISPCWY